MTTPDHDHGGVHSAETMEAPDAPFLAAERANPSPNTHQLTKCHQNNPPASGSLLGRIRVGARPSADARKKWNM